MSLIRVLFLSDTHLGFDLPLRPRIARRRRGPEFYAAFDRALEPALNGEVDLVIHGGDLFFRSRIRQAPVKAALERIEAVAARGIPFLIVPGNHERGALPDPLFWTQPNVHIFDRPRTFRLTCRRARVAVAGFPYSYADLPRAFPDLLARTGLSGERADLRLLAMHQAVAGARVGIQDFMFRRGRDVIPGRLIPSGIAAVLSGHIHRAQILDMDPVGRPLAARVLYAGATQRTSFAERAEEKGYFILSFGAEERGPGALIDHRFVVLPSRPMIVRRVAAGGLTESSLAQFLSDCDPEALVRFVIEGEVNAGAARMLRALAPVSMNVELRPDDRRRQTGIGIDPPQAESIQLFHR